MTKSKSFKSSISEKAQKLVVPLSKIAQQKHLNALKDGFALALPLTIAGAIAILFVTIVFGGWGAEKTSIFGILAHASGYTTTSFAHLYDASTTWTLTGGFAEIAAFGQQIFGWVNGATLGSIGIYAALLVSFSMALVRGYKHPIMAAIAGFAVFLAFTGADASYFGARGMLIAILSAIAGTEFFVWLSNTGKMDLKLPASVPPAVGRAFGVLFPMFITVFLAAAINVLVSLPYYGLLHQSLRSGSSLQTMANIIQDFIQQPFLKFARSGGDVALLFLYLPSICILFFFGIHGPNTLAGIFAPLSILLWIDNMSGGHNVALEQVWNGFISYGGNGATLPLVVMSILFMKVGSPTREVAKFALPAGIFEINEPVIFGFPIMFNFKWVIPYVLGPTLACVWPVIAIKFELMNAPTILAPWTTPPILYGLIVTQFDWRSIIVSMLTLVTITAVYLPFFLLNKKDEEKEMAKQAKLATKGGN